MVNVKLSDYGISCFATPQGVAGDEGTPGYQAPEIRPGIGYDEKVRQAWEGLLSESSHVGGWRVDLLPFQCLFLDVCICISVS